MQSRLFCTCILSFVIAAPAAHTAQAQDYPVKPVRIVTGGSGGGNDFSARLIAQGLSSSMGQQVFVENRGGSTVIPIMQVMKAAPDGYTWLFLGRAFWTLPYMDEKVSYEPLRDFAPVTITVHSSSLLVVHPSLPVKSAKELIALAKARPGQIDYATGSTGAPTHYASELFRSLSGIDMVRVTYKGTAPALAAVLSGEVQLTFTSAASVAPYVKTGRLRVIGVTSMTPSVLAPGVAPIATSGLPGYESRSLYAVLVPAKTPATLINRINQEIARVLNTQDARAKLENIGMEVVASSPEQAAAAIKTEMSTTEKMMKDGNLRAH